MMEPTPAPSSKVAADRVSPVQWLGCAGVAGVICWCALSRIVVSVSRGEAYSRIERSFGAADLRVTAYRERTTGFALPGGIFVVEKRSAGTPWVEIYETRHDDPIPIPFQAVAVSGDRFFLQGRRELTVTADGGKSWKTWTTWRDLEPSLRGSGYTDIETVSMGGDGVGIMVLSSPARGDPAELRTKDGGQSWSPRP